MPILSGFTLRHKFVPVGSHKVMSQALVQPDDITMLGHALYTAFQNGVGAQGEPSLSGNTFSTVVEFTAAGHVIRQWDILGKCDGLTADPAKGYVIATVNEDAKSSIYTITPSAPPGKQVQHYLYNKPLPHMGGTDSISVFHGFVLIAASAPGTSGGPPAPQPYPAVYLVTFIKATHVAVVIPVFGDEDKAIVANPGPGHGKTIKLALTDPDSSEVVPASAPRFGGDFMLGAQGDLQQIFRQPKLVSKLSVLTTSQSTDDSAWVTSRSGHLYGTDSSNNQVSVVTGKFPIGTMFVAVTPCNANSAPASPCPAPGFPPNYLGVENMSTGNITAVGLLGPGPFNPKGLLFVP